MNKLKKLKVKLGIEIAAITTASALCAYPLSEILTKKGHKIDVANYVVNHLDEYLIFKAEETANLAAYRTKRFYNEWTNQEPPEPPIKQEFATLEKINSEYSDIQDHSGIRIPHLTLDEPYRHIGADIGYNLACLIFFGLGSLRTRNYVKRRNEEKRMQHLE